MSFHPSIHSFVRSFVLIDESVSASSASACREAGAENVMMR